MICRELSCKNCDLRLCTRDMDKCRRGKRDLGCDSNSEITTLGLRPLNQLAKGPDSALSSTRKCTLPAYSPVAKLYMALHLCHALLMVLHTEITPDERTKLLETTSLFADIHAGAATAGQTEVPRDLHTDLHFTWFVESAHNDGTGSRGFEFNGACR